MITREHHFVDTPDGWRLKLRQCVDPDARIPARRPLVIIPGYGMNSFIIGYHPSGRSMEEYLAGAGFDVWAANMRAQEGCVALGGRRDHGMKEVSVTDISAILAHVCAHTGHEWADVVGCSLGGTMVFAHLALVPDHRIASVIALGAPLRWVEVHPLLRGAFSSPWLARRLRLRHTRGLAFGALTLLKYLPFMLRIYVHPEISDISQAKVLINSVEDPNPVMNEEIVRWVINRDLIIDGINVTDALRDVTNPLLLLTGNADGIVPRATALFPLDWVASTRKDFVEVGDERHRYAHADLYISRYSRERVFSVMAEWLAGCYEG
jgi:pimeloyl-ACP methyl ester carboxylesterase